MASGPRPVRAEADTGTDLNRELVALRAEFDLLSAALDRLEAERLLQRIIRIETMFALADPTKWIQEIATLREQVAELKRWRESSRGRDRLFWLAVALMMFVSNTIIACILYFVREPG